MTAGATGRAGRASSAGRLRAASDLAASDALARAALGRETGDQARQSYSRGRLTSTATFARIVGLEHLREEAMKLEDALYPIVALELVKPVYTAGGVVWAAAGDTVLARGAERGRFAAVILTHPKRGTKIECGVDDLDGAAILEEVPL